MNVLIDTSNKDLFLLLVDNGVVIRHIWIKNLVKKADALPGAFLGLLQEHKTKEVTNFYITIGPGSFTGARTALVFARSICQITKAKLHTTSSIQLIAGPSGTHKIYIDARSNKSYFAVVENGKLKKPIQLVDFQEPTKQKYLHLISNFLSFKILFHEEKNILDVYPIYIKDPNIGGSF